VEHADDLKKFDQAVSEAKNIDKLLGELRFEIQQDPEQIKFDKLDREKKEKQEKVTILQDAQKSVYKKLNDRYRRWISWLKRGTSIQLDGIKDALVVDDTLLTRLNSGADEHRLGAMKQLAWRFAELRESVLNLVRSLQNQIDSADKNLRQLAKDIDCLYQGQPPGAFPLLHALREKLGDRVEQLGRLIEVKPEAERWWPALESFLGRHRWVIVVSDAKDYRDALEILRRVPPGQKPESLLNPSEVSAAASEPAQDSLFLRVEVCHPIARKYVQRLLGEVVCVENIEELEQCPAGRAITPEGVFKQIPLRRRLQPADTVQLTLGREGLRRMQIAKERQQIDTRALRDSLQQKKDDIDEWLKVGREGGLGDAEFPNYASELPQLPELQRELSRIRETIAVLTTPEREARQEKLSELENRKVGLDQDIGGLRTSKQTFSLRIKKPQDGIEAAKEAIAKLETETQLSRSELSLRFSGILDAELVERTGRLRAEFPKWNDCMSALQERTFKAAQSAVEARANRNNERTLMATSRDEQGNLRHPEYQHEFPVEDDNNEEWDNRLRVLETIELEKSRKLAADQKLDWEKRLARIFHKAMKRSGGDCV